MAGSDRTVRYSVRLQRMVADPRVRADLMPFMTDDEIGVVLRRIDPLMEAYDDWCAAWPLIRPDLLIVTAMHAIVHAPHLSNDAMMPYLKMSVWNVALDDAFDAPDLSEAHALAIARELIQASARVPSQNPRSELARGLEEIVEDLSRFPNFDAIYPIWTALFAQSIEGMLYEYFLRKRFSPSKLTQDLPDLDEYLHFATHSLTVVFLFTASLIVEPTARFLPVLSQLVELVERCSRIGRLVNDMKTYEREVKEGAISAVTLLVHEQLRQQTDANLTAMVDRAKAEIKAMIDFELAEAEGYSSRIGSGTGVEQGFLRATRFQVDMYLKEDYRKWLLTVSRVMSEREV